MAAGCGNFPFSINDKPARIAAATNTVFNEKKFLKGSRSSAFGRPRSGMGGLRQGISRLTNRGHVRWFSHFAGAEVPCPLSSEVTASSVSQVSSARAQVSSRSGLPKMGRFPSAVAQAAITCRAVAGIARLPLTRALRPLDGRWRPGGKMLLPATSSHSHPRHCDQQRVGFSPRVEVRAFYPSSILNACAGLQPSRFAW